MRPDLLQGAWAAGRIVPLATAQQRAELAVALGPGDRRGVLEP